MSIVVADGFLVEVALCSLDVRIDVADGFLVEVGRCNLDVRIDVADGFLVKVARCYNSLKMIFEYPTMFSCPKE